MRKNKYKESHLLLFRNLNLRIARLERFALLVSIDSLTSFSPSANAPLGHHSDRSPLHCHTGSVLIGKPKLLTQHKKADHREGDPFFVEHRRFELLTPTLPVLCATNCANAPNSGYIIITSGLCKAFFSVRFPNTRDACCSRIRKQGLTAGRNPGLPAFQGPERQSVIAAVRNSG